ncbi:MAG: hypothetical protein OXT07_06925 [bacterium]|nr:hypothetical protein [bacterium]MDE0238210.1 hypothetical protein [bacterium]
MSDDETPNAPPELGDGELVPGDATDVPEQLEDGQLVAQSLQASMSSFSGPLPPPEMYAAYERQVPGTAEWMRGEVAKAREERHAFVMRHLELEHRGNRLAAVLLITLVLAAVLAVLAMAWFLFETGKPVYGGVATLSDVLLVGFTITRIRRPKRPPDDQPAA